MILTGRSSYLNRSTNIELNKKLMGILVIPNYYCPECKSLLWWVPSEHEDKIEVGHDQQIDCKLKDERYLVGYDCVIGEIIDTTKTK